jgi:hypothetical protein
MAATNRGAKRPRVFSLFLLNWGAADWAMSIFFDQPCRAEKSTSDGSLPIQPDGWITLAMADES